MNNTSILVLLLLPLITICINQNAILSLTWLAGHCEYLGGHCNKQQYAQWDHQSFLINGLWPNQKLTRNFGDFNYNHLKSKGIIEQLYNYWPPQLKTGGLPHFLWQSSWDNHGQNYAAILMQIDSRSYMYLTILHRNEALQASYFQRTIEFYKALNVRKLPKNTFTKSTLAKQINIPQQSFYPVCLSSGTLRQIRICTKITVNSFNLRKCSKQKSNCDDRNLILRDWKSSQELSDELRAQNQVYTSQKEHKIQEIIQRIEIQTQGFTDMSRISNESQVDLDAIQQIIIDSRIVQIKKLSQQKPQFNDVLIEMELQQIIIEEFEDTQTEDELQKSTIDINNKIAYTQQQVSQRVIKYMSLTLAVVSIFWVSLFILCCCSRLTNKKKSNNQKISQTPSSMIVQKDKSKLELQQ